MIWMIRRCVLCLSPSRLSLFTCFDFDRSMCDSDCFFITDLILFAPFYFGYLFLVFPCLAESPTLIITIVGELGN